MMSVFARCSRRFDRSGRRPDEDQTPISISDEAQRLAQMRRRHVHAAAVHAGDEVATACHVTTVGLSLSNDSRSTR
jgi:hypothetical protein